MEKILYMFETNGRGRKHNYYDSYDMKKDKKILENLMEEVTKPQILCYDGLKTISFSDDSSIGYDCLDWLYETKKIETNTEGDMRECLLKCAVEDIEWTKERNEGYTDICYRKITFLPEIQKILIEKCLLYIQTLDTMIAQAEAKENEKKLRFKEWKLVETYKYTKPSGGEYGTDGYIDADYQNTSGDIVRMVSQSIFDVGVYHYPKRLKGTPAVFDISAMSETEKNLIDWLSKFGEFHGTRM